MEKVNVESFINQRPENRTGLQKLRKLLLNAGLTETIKWNFPVYTLDDKNIAGLGSFQSYYGLWFFQGCYLKDDSQVLINAQEGKTQAMRQWRFTREDCFDIELVKKYVEEAIENHKHGLEFKPQKKPLILPEELKKQLAADDLLSEAFELLNLTRKREFAEYIADAKQEATKLKRLEKIKPMIMTGTGLNDKYK